MISATAAHAIAAYVDGAPTLDLARLDSDLARQLGQALIDANGTGRLAALDAVLDTLPREEADSVKSQIFATDPASPPPEPHAGGPVTRERAPCLPEAAQPDAALGQDTGAWLDAYTAYAGAVSPMTQRLFHESAGLWLASTAIARRLVVRLPFGPVYPNLAAIWIAPTTLWAKSTGLTLARDLARRLFPHLLAPQDMTVEAFVSDLAGMEPTHLDKLPDDARGEWEAERNFAAQRGLVVDEISGLLASAGRDYNGGLLEVLLRLYDCDPRFVRSTRNQGRVVVRHSYLTLLGASTPTAMAPPSSGPPSLRRCRNGCSMTSPPSRPHGRRRT